MEIAFILFLNQEKLVHLVVVVFSLSSGSFSLSFAQISDFNADFISVNSRLPVTEKDKEGGPGLRNDQIYFMRTKRRSRKRKSRRKRRIH